MLSISMTVTMKKHINIALAAALSCVSAIGVSAQSFSALYEKLPDLSLDQAYCALLDFQKSNPYFGNVYMQLGDVSEKKLVLFDPLRENPSVRYWGQNVKLFYGNLRAYYKDGDVRTEYYENFKIPFSGKRVEDADFWSYVNNRMAMAKNHVDSTTMIYTAIERSKFFYDKCLEAYTQICDDYVNLNDLLLRYDEQLSKRMDNMDNYITQCLGEFDEYKRLIKLYPVLDYRQFYEKKAIETFRLDGLTNSDFYKNRFFIWDYQAWIAECRTKIEKDILPLRAEVTNIDNAYRDGRTEFQNAKPQQVVLNKPYDDMFIFRLGRYDNSSIVRELFGYLEQTRQMVLLAGDSIGRNVPFNTALENRKMRQIYRIVKLSDEAANMRSQLSKNITSAKVARFSDFFKTNYGGEAGFRRFVDSDGEFCNQVIDDVCNATADYIISVSRQKQYGVDGTYSVARGAAAPVVPLWVVQDPQSVTSKYVTTRLAVNSRGNVVNVAGCMKSNAQSWFVAGISADGQTDWVLSLKGVSSVEGIAITDDGGCLVNAVRNLKPVIIRVGADGKEKGATTLDVERLDLMDYDVISGKTLWVSGSDNALPVISRTDSLGNVAWTVSLTGLSKVGAVNVVSTGLLVTGVTPDNSLATVLVSQEGVAAEPIRIMTDVDAVVTSARISAQEIAMLVRAISGKHTYVMVSDKGSKI